MGGPRVANNRRSLAGPSFITKARKAVSDSLAVGIPRSSYLLEATHPSQAWYEVLVPSAL